MMLFRLARMSIVRNICPVSVVRCVVCSLVVGASSVKFMSRLIVFSFVGLLVLSSCVVERYAFEMSRNYTPVYNPGGDLFGEDEDFAQSYEIYEKRRTDMLKDREDARRSRGESGKQRPRGQRISDAEKEKIEEQLRGFGALPRKMAERGRGRMVNKEGVDLSQIKGARFIDVLVEGGTAGAGKKEESNGPSNYTDNKDVGLPQVGDGVGKESGREHGEKQSHVHVGCECGSSCDCEHKHNKSDLHDDGTLQAEEEQVAEEESRISDVGGQSDYGLTKRDATEGTEVLEEEQRGGFLGEEQVHSGGHGENQRQQQEACKCDDEWCSSCDKRYGEGAIGEYGYARDDFSGYEGMDEVLETEADDKEDGPLSAEVVSPEKGGEAPSGIYDDGTNVSGKDLGVEESASGGVLQEKKGDDIHAEHKQKGNDELFPLGFEDGRFAVGGEDDDERDFTVLQEDRLQIKKGPDSHDKEKVSPRGVVDLGSGDNDDYAEKYGKDTEDRWSDDAKGGVGLGNFDDKPLVKDSKEKEDSTVPPVHESEVSEKDSVSSTESGRGNLGNVDSGKSKPSYRGLSSDYDEDDDYYGIYGLPIKGEGSRFYDFGTFVDGTLK